MGPRAAAGCLLLALSGLLLPGKAETGAADYVSAADAGLAEATARRVSANLTNVNLTEFTSTTAPTTTEVLNNSAAPSMQEAYEDFNDTSSTTEGPALITGYDLSPQQSLCLNLRPILGVWFATYLLGSTTVLFMVIFGLKDRGAIMAMPMLAGLRYNLFAGLWVQGLMHVLEAFAETSEDGCTVRETFLVVGDIPMPAGMSWSRRLPEAATSFAILADNVLSGYLVLLLLIAMPRMRMMFRPEAGCAEGAEPTSRLRCCPCVPERLTRYCALPALLLLIWVNPIVLLLTHREDLTAALERELIIFIIGLILASMAARREREELARLFEHIFLQEWGVLSAAIFTKFGNIFISQAFEPKSAGFLIGLAGSLSSLGVMVYLVFATSPWKDPMIWLAGQEWMIEHSQAFDADSPETRRHRRSKIFHFVLSMFNFPWTFKLVLKDDLKRCGIEPRLKHAESDAPSWKSVKESHELDLGQKAWAEWASWAEKVCSFWPGLKDQHTTDELTNVEPPTSLTPEERALKQEGKLKRRSRWCLVCADLFSDRVHSQEVMVIVLVLIISEPTVWWVLTTNLNFFQVDASLALLIQSMLFCLAVWVLMSLMLVGNNVFLPVLFQGHIGRRLWLIGLGLFALFMTFAQFYTFLIATGDPTQWAFGDATIQIVFNMSHVTLSAALTSAVFRLVFVSHMPQVRNTYHRLEFAAQRYCQRLLEGEAGAVGQQQKEHQGQTQETRNAKVKDLSRRLIKGETLVEQTVQPGQVFLVKRGRGTRPCLVTETREDGTCSITLQGGQMIKDVLHKDLQPLYTEDRLVRQDKDFFESIVETLAPALDSLRQGRDRVFEGIKVIGNNLPDVYISTASSKREMSMKTSTSEPAEKEDTAKTVEKQDAGESAKKQEAAKPPEPAEPLEQKDDPETSPSRGALGILDGFSLFKARFLETERGMALTRAVSADLTRSATRHLEAGGLEAKLDEEALAEAKERAADAAAEYALVEHATDKGKQRALQMERQRQQAQGFRLFFNSSVGLSGLMLAALVVGPILMALSATYMCTKVTEFERGVSRMRSGAAYALRVQSRGFHYGACRPPTDQEREACEHAVGDTPCGPPAAMLMWAFDANQSRMLEPPELDHMCRVLSGISVAAAIGGREESGLARTDCREITRQVSWSGHDLIGDEWSMDQFICSVSQHLRRQNEQIQEALVALENMENVSRTILFPLADRNPRDGFLTEQELLTVVPAGALGPRQQELADTYGMAVRIAFLLGDTQPADGRLSPQEADVAIEYIGRLMRTVPRLAEDISAVQSGQRPTLNTALFIEIVDINGDGIVSRVEISILASILDSTSSSPNMSRQVMAIFDMVDSDGDGLVQQGDLDQLLGRLAGGLAMLAVMSGEGDGELGAQSLLQVLDTNQDGALSRAEFDALATFFPPQHSAQAAFAISLIFSQADTSPRDGRLDSAEIEVAVQRIQALVQQFNQSPGNAAGNAAGNAVGAALQQQGATLPQQPPLPGRRLGARAPAPRRRMIELHENADAVDFAAQLSGLFASTVFEGEQDLINNYIRRYLWVFNSDEFLIVAPLVILGMRLSIVGAVASACLMMLKTKREHERLTQRMQMGDHSYVGASQKNLLRKSFSVSTSFPGIFIATVVINFLVAVLVIFVILVVTVTPIVLAILPGTRHIIRDTLQLLSFPILAALLKWLLKAVVVDWLLVEHGQPIYPYLFAPLWLTLVLLNSVQAPFFAVFRWATLVVYACLTSTYLHICAVSESVMSLDPGYFAFIALTFTQSARRNLVRTCFISALMPQTQRARGPAAKQEGDETPEERERRKRRLIIRNKLWVAVTLWNNPELRETRRLHRDREFSSLMTLWQGQETLIPRATEPLIPDDKGTSVHL